MKDGGRRSFGTGEVAKHEELRKRMSYGRRKEE
jgi:hypothetical protein